MRHVSSRNPKSKLLFKKPPENSRPSYMYSTTHIARTLPPRPRWSRLFFPFWGSRFVGFGGGCGVWSTFSTWADSDIFHVEFLFDFSYCGNIHPSRNNCFIFFLSKSHPRSLQYCQLHVVYAMAFLNLNLNLFYSQALNDSNIMFGPFPSYFLFLITTI